MPNRRLIAIAFIESFAAVTVQRGVYFFARSVLGFSDTANLSLALVFGASYVAGAMSSQLACTAAGERGVLLTVLLAQVLVHAGVAAHPAGATVFAGMVAIGVLNGMKWPVVESYVSAGQPPDAAAKSIGRFNVSWATAVPLALAAAGPVLHAWPRALFLIPAALDLGALALTWRLPRCPGHLAADHAHRPPAKQLAHLGHLMTSARWLLLLSYAAMWMLAALLPGIMGRLGYGVSTAAGLSSLMDVARLLAFAVLSCWMVWAGRSSPLFAAMVGLPGGFFLVLLGQTGAAVFLGLVLFGLAAGVVYHAALCYAMLVKNASVGAGGGHEGLIGLGFAVGPAAGLLAAAMQQVLGSHTLAVLAGVGPLFAICLAASARHALKAVASRRVTAAGDS